MTQTCTLCRRSNVAFYKTRRSHCVECTKEGNRKRYKRNPKATIIKTTAYRKANWTRLSNARRKREGLPEATRPEPGACECCGNRCLRGGLAVDHDHATGKFRGWLCRRCNLGIGSLGDNLAGARNAVAYFWRAK